MPAVLRKKPRTGGRLRKCAPEWVGGVRAALISILCVQAALAGQGGGGGGGGSQSSNSSQGGTGSSQNSQSQAQGGGQSGGTSSLGGTVLAYDYVKAAGNQIASDVADLNMQLKAKGLAINTVLITTTPPNQAGNLATYFFLRKFYTDLTGKYDSAESQLKAQKANAPLIPTETAGDLASAFATLVGLFGTTTTFTSGTAAADPMALVPNICSTLLASKKGTITPIYVDLSIDTSFIADPNSLASILQAVTDRRLESTMYINAGLNQKNPAILNDVTNIMACNAMYDSFSTNFSAAAIGSMLNLDYIQTKMRQPGCYLLYVTNSYVIPEMRVKSNPVLNIFTDGQRLSFVGGGGVAYFLYDMNMNMVKAGRFDGYIGYKKYHYQWFPWLRHIQTDLDVPN